MSRFDRYMLHVDIGTDEKFADLTDAERLCHVVGVLAVAAKSPVRGYLIVGNTEATVAHIARRAAVSSAVASSTLAKLVAVGVLVRDEEIGALRVHSWERFNPEPKVDPTNAERQARWRTRQKVTPVTAESNGESNGPLTRTRAKRADARSFSSSTSSLREVVAVVAEEPQTSKEISSSARVTDRSAVWRHYAATRWNDPERPLPKDEAKTIGEALDVSTVGECCRAIDGCWASTWHQGQNPSGAKYRELSQILKGKRGGKTTAEQIRFMGELVDSTPVMPTTGNGMMIRKLLDGIAAEQT